MRFGAHVSAAGGLWNGPINAGEIGCEVFQFFSRPPQGGNPAPITPEVVTKFKAAMKEHGQKDCYIHAPYFINLASGTDRIRKGSHAVLREELERGSLLGVRGMMFHPGSAKDVGQEKGIEMVIEGLNKIMDGYKGSCQLLVEISAGAGEVMGDTFEEIAAFLKGAERGKEIGVCFDTQHAFASGYDLRDVKAVTKTFKDFDKIVGLDRLVASHLNDSKIELGGHKDRHESIGKGLLGKEGIKAVTQHKPLKHIDLLLETPVDEERAGELNLLKSWRKV